MSQIKSINPEEEVLSLSERIEEGRRQVAEGEVEKPPPAPVRARSSTEGTAVLFDRPTFQLATPATGPTLQEVAVAAALVFGFIAILKD